MEKDFELHYILRRIGSLGSYPFHILIILFLLFAEFYVESFQLILSFIPKNTPSLAVGMK